MSNVFVINSITETTSEKSPRLAYKNIANTSSSVVASHAQASAIYTYDGMTTLKWRPANTTPSLTFNGAFNNVDCVALAGVNWQTASAVLTVKDSLNNTLATVSGLRDNQPVLLTIAKANYTQIKLEFTCSNTLLEVGEIYISESLIFPRNVSIGYAPARWTTRDEISTTRTQSNQFGAATITQRGSTERFSIKYVPLDYMNNEFKTFFDFAKGIPVFFLWNKIELGHAVFGHWELSDPTFESSFFSSINMTINGVG